MLSFVIFDGDRPATDRALRHASLVGPDDVPVAGEIHFEDGLVHCVKTTAESAGLATQVDLDAETLAEFHDPSRDDADLPMRPLGSLTLRTCLLPERNQPYLLSLELARHQLMRLMNRMEDHQLFVLEPDHPVQRLFEAARLAFTASLVAQREEASTEGTHGFGVRSHHEALRSLWLSLEAGERLALEAARRTFEPRCSGAGYDKSVESMQGAPPSGPRSSVPVVNHAGPGIVLPTRPAIGCTVSPGSFSEEAQHAARRACEFVSVPMRWVDLEPNEGQYAYASTDRWIEWAVRTARLPVAAGPVIDFAPGSAPDWLYIWENDYETLRELVYEHLKAVVTRYRRTVTRWTVASGLHVNSNFNLKFEQMMDLTRICVLVVRKLHPNAKVFVELTQPWGEYFTSDRRSLPPMLYAEMLLQSGIHVDGFGLQVLAGAPGVGQGTRDLQSLSVLLDHAAALERPIALTGVGAPCRDIPGKDPANPPGWWRSSWSDQTQADWATASVGVALSKPFVESVCWAELSDVRSPRPGFGLTDAQGAPRPVLERLEHLRGAAADARLPDAFTPESLFEPAAEARSV